MRTSGLIATGVSCVLASSVVAIAQSPVPPAPPKAAWTAASQTISTAAFSSCWTANAGDRGVCGDGVAPRCARPSTKPPTLVLPNGRQAGIRIVLGFRPTKVVAELIPDSGNRRVVKLPKARGVLLRVPSEFQGGIHLYATRDSATSPGSATYGVCVSRGVPAGR